jgi:hypothetical protein
VEHEATRQVSVSNDKSVRAVGADLEVDLTVFVRLGKFDIGPNGSNIFVEYEGKGLLVITEGASDGAGGATTA